MYKCTDNLYTNTTTLLIILKFYDTSTDIKTPCNHLCTMVSLLSSLLRTCDCWSMNKKKPKQNPLPIHVHVLSEMEKSKIKAQSLSKQQQI